jgi:hypothetical protein
LPFLVVNVCIGRDVFRIRLRLEGDVGRPAAMRMLADGSTAIPATSPSASIRNLVLSCRSPTARLRIELRHVHGHELSAATGSRGPRVGDGATMSYPLFHD